MSLTNFQVQSATVGYIKTQASVTTLLCTGSPSGVEVREDQWHGVDFCYPNVRVRLDDLQPDKACTFYTINMTILVFSEEASSQQADVIAGAVQAIFDKKAMTTGGVHFMSIHVANVIPAVREGLVWKAEVTINALGHAA